MASKLDNDLLQFADEPDISEISVVDVEAPWRILVVDDDEDVHLVTRLSLKCAMILGRKVELHDAYSSSEALEKLKNDPTFAVVLLDVVMETDDAGFRVVRAIRNDLQNHDIRIILRTGQSGHAPEMDVVSKYDINDYRLKTELTRVHLISAITAALRAYEQIDKLRQTQDDLKAVNKIVNGLMQETTLEAFCLRAIQGIQTLTHYDYSVLMVRHVLAPKPSVCRCLAGTGTYENLLGLVIAPQDPLMDLFRSSDTARDANMASLRPAAIKVAHIGNSAFYLHFSVPLALTSIQQQSLDVLLSSISIGLEKQIMIERLSNIAWNDRLTQLPNRASLIAKLDDILGKEQQHTLMLLNLDGFGTINDGLGQEVGDATLIEVSRRLLAIAEDRIFVARVYGDTFATLGRSSEISFQKIKQAFATPIKTGHSDIRIAASFGTLIGANGCDSAENAFRKATMALHRSKQGERGSNVTYQPEMDIEVQERLELAALLVAALNDKQLLLHYQPKVRYQDGKVIGVEALMRWPLGDDFIPPWKFIPVAETSGLIYELERFLVDRACEDLNTVTAAGFPDMTMAINVSASVLETQSFYEYFVSTIAQHSIPADRLCIELTEETDSRNQQQLINRLQQYRALGVKVSLDDFGTGYNSLAHLNTLPIDQIKVDKSFVDTILTDDKARRLNKAIVLIAQTMGLEIVAEGIEQQEQSDIMKAIGCDQAQGYLFSKPLPLAALLEWFKTQQ